MVVLSLNVGGGRRADSGLAGEERIAVHVERASVLLAAGATEGVDGLTDLDVDEACAFEESLPACARQATGDSTGPQIDVALRFLGHWPPVGDVRELDHAA